MQREKGEGGADEAIALYKKALEVDPKCASAHWEMGWSLQTKSDWEGCVAAWDKVKALDAAYPELTMHYAMAKKRRDEIASLKSLPEPGKVSAPEEAPATGDAIRLMAVGDINMGMAWPEERAQLPPDDAKDFFNAVSPILSSADVAFGNVETVLADSGDSRKCGKKSTKCFAFRVPSSFAKSIQSAGFDVVSIANNHAGDFGPEGRKATMAALDKVGVLHSGPIGDIAKWEVKGRKLALIAFSTGGETYRLQDMDMARKVVAGLAKENDVVIVSFHGGAEGESAQHVPKGPEKFYGEDRGDVRAFAHAMIDVGADLVLGHGPHVFRGLERYKSRLIAYSMGNFSSWEVFGLGGPKGVSGIFEFTLAPNGVALGLKVHPTFLDEPGLPKPDPKNRAIDSLRRLSKEDFGDALLDEAGVWKSPAATAAAR